MKRIPSNRPFFPNRSEFDKLVDGIWERKWITNQGDLVTELEKKMGDFLEVPHISFVSSGTTGLQLALKCLPEKGEVITTPFSYPATTNAIIQEGFTPIFADILPGKLTVDPAVIKSLIGPKTAAIMPVHVYGNNCDTDAIDEISGEFNIPAIYDAAHSFGARKGGKSIFGKGDFSVLSTHATKMFHTANGGFVVCKTAQDRQRIDRLKNFGHNGPNTFELPGINGKNSELHAAMGLCNMMHANAILEKRKNQWAYYRDALQKQTGIELLQLSDEAGYNGAYFPVIFKSADLCRKAIDEGVKRQIELRKYFSPSLNQLQYLDYQVCPVAESTASRTCCLPLYHEMERAEQDRVIALIASL
ncbi:MAG: DegT/DnrJ/EryC1/StrS family aminotransferase [Flavobacteriales bacterium]|nr:DegT/DnrJ/EryC1/StrS family aminotransferase [Flavobacteriales bacterium]